MDPLLKLLQQNSKVSLEELAAHSGVSEEEVARRIDAYEKEGVILGYRAVVDSERAGQEGVTSVIEVRIRPERGGGFERVARRIAKFDQVVNCYLMSGAYDLLVFIEGETLQEVASFVAEKLSTLEGVLSTATHFRLKTYKENGLIPRDEEEDDRLPVSP